MHALEAYDLIRFAQHTLERLDAAGRALSESRGKKREKSWLASASEVLKAELDKVGPLLERALELSELDVVRAERASDLIGVWVDALEKLLAGVTFHAGVRAPIIEALFKHQRFPLLRKATFEAADEYALELERRLKSSYVERMLKEEQLAVLRPVVEEATAAFEAVRAARAPAELPMEERDAIAAELSAAALVIELTLSQAKLVAEAALLTSPEVLERSGLREKRKKRAQRPAAKAEAGEGEATPAEASVDSGSAGASESTAVEAAESAAKAPVSEKPKRAKKTQKPAAKNGALPKPAPAA